ncbi:hypothetical protein Q5P01_024019 [Channa striata]|uniref:Uncharacterized protein n=1 Tax=Channa striata TaxID=64152 RepID=A0AA88LP55_CHASR|nr:hypothetical protein Q5P01_024019 [Channa striata]
MKAMERIILGYVLTQRHSKVAEDLWMNVMKSICAALEQQLTIRTKELLSYSSCLVSAGPTGVSVSPVTLAKKVWQEVLPVG